MDITIFTSPGCRSCENAKALLRQHGVVFTERNVAADSAAMAILVARGCRSLPVIQIGDEWTEGFDHARLHLVLRRVLASDL